MFALEGEDVRKRTLRTCINRLDRLCLKATNDKRLDGYPCLDDGGQAMLPIDEMSFPVELDGFSVEGPLPCGDILAEGIDASRSDWSVDRTRGDIFRCDLG